ncbi:MAG: aspartate/tyrosine/aromatic aminotransferase [Betaproteobacteria bacterium]|nr:aspartate/tyrosine/aromatic aminotransferase [Betaproteobacteria bacterium]
MNAPHAPSLLAGVEMAPRDPILGMTELYGADKNPNKVNLGVGVYYDDAGRVPLLECVKRAEQQMLTQAAPHAYLPIDGIPAYDKAVRDLVFGADSAPVREGRVVTVQALGGTGGLKVGADFLRRIAPDAQVWISDPSWENHRALFEGSGFAVNAYPYYDAATHGLDFEAMLSSLRAVPAGSIIVLHACCHNPTGVDLNAGQWEAVLKLVRERALVPFLDIAYQGFAEGLSEDGAVVRRFAETSGPVFVSNSFSKSISLYGERVGALSVVAESADEAARVLSQLKRVVRANYSNPPSHGGAIVTAILTDRELRAMWEKELGAMRERIRTLRKRFVEGLHAKVPGSDFSFVVRQRGMFSYSGLTKDVVVRLREEYAVYALESGRVCVAALNAKNLDYVIDSIASVLRR